MWGMACPPPGTWDPLGGLRDLDPPADRGDHVVLLRYQLVELVNVVSSTLYLRD